MSVCSVKVPQLFNVKDLRDFEGVSGFLLVETFFPLNCFNSSVLLHETEGSLEQFV